MRLTRQHFEWVANNIAPMVSWPSHIHSIADKLEATNPNFNRDRFIERATSAWEKNYEGRYPSNCDDEIPY